MLSESPGHDYGNDYGHDWKNGTRLRPCRVLGLSDATRLARGRKNVTVATFDWTVATLHRSRSPFPVQLGPTVMTSHNALEFGTTV